MSNMYFSEFSEYLLLEKNYSKLTAKAYLTDLNLFAKFLLQNYQVDNFNEVDYGIIRRWVVLLSEEGISNRSINRKTTALKSYYKFLCKTEVVSVNPLAQHKSLKVKKKVILPFSKDEVSDVLKLLRGNCHDYETYRDYLIVELFYALGLRRAELIELKISDIDFSNQSIKVLGKRNKERIIPLLEGTVTIIQEYIVYYKQKYKIKENAPLFLSNKGVKIYESFVFRLVNSYFSKASVKIKKSPHILRHSFATHLLTEGAELNAVKELLGHSSLAATQVYTNNDIDQLAKVYKRAHPRNK